MSQTSHPLLVTVAAIGGISKQHAIADGIDPADIKYLKAGLRWVFRADGGLTMDGALEQIKEAGEVPTFWDLADFVEAVTDAVRLA